MVPFNLAQPSRRATPTRALWSLPASQTAPARHAKDRPLWILRQQACNERGGVIRVPDHSRVSLALAALDRQREPIVAVIPSLQPVQLLDPQAHVQAELHDISQLLRVACVQ